MKRGWPDFDRVLFTVMPGLGLGMIVYDETRSLFWAGASGIVCASVVLGASKWWLKRQMVRYSYGDNFHIDFRYSRTYSLKELWREAAAKIRGRTKRRRQKPIEPRFLKLFSWCLSRARRIEVQLMINDEREVAQEMAREKYPRAVIRLVIAWHTVRNTAAILYDGCVCVLAKLLPAVFMLRRVQQSKQPEPPEEPDDTQG